ncbi:hypothetical protein EGM_10055 [Macaca fascicularis]|uniref:Ig-like domain-containing protein n=1 Tax=Macaca fascicularis TaxID=9541 RepID=G7PYI4_MACFA|nr:hypothetical protein EGM_10055 [Macaca fascicularis]
MPRAEGYLARIRPVQLTHHGTFSCVIKQDQRPLARLYFFLLLVRPEALTPSNLFLLAALGALASASATVLAWIFFRWYCSGD